VHSHAVTPLGSRPLLSGANARFGRFRRTLIVIVLAQTGSVRSGCMYLAIFGIGSIAECS